MNWARRLKRVFWIEIEQCARCGGRLKVIASIEEPELIERILAHRRERGEEDATTVSLGACAQLGLSALLGLFVFGGPAAGQPVTSPDAPPASTSVGAEESRMWMTIGERRFSITLADTTAARAFVALLPLTLDMAEINGNEKFADLPRDLPTNASRPGTIRNGDLLLYGSKTLVVFYLTFDSSFSYTAIGRVDDPADLAQTLGRFDVRVAFSQD